MAEKIDIPVCECLKCGWKWQPRVSEPRMCPNCRTLRWDEPKKDNGDGQKTN